MIQLERYNLVSHDTRRPEYNRGFIIIPKPLHVQGMQRQRGGVTVPFPIKLHQVLEQVEADGFADCIAWQPHGRCFVIHKPNAFVEQVMPR